MMILDDGETNPVLLWAEIHRLRAELKGPDGFKTWHDAAVAERLLRVECKDRIESLERQLAEAQGKVADVRRLAEKWNKDAVADGFAMSEPAGELLDLLDAAPSPAAADKTNSGGV